MVDTLLEHVIDIKSEDLLKIVNGTERPKQMINMTFFKSLACFQWFTAEYSTPLKVFLKLTLLALLDTQSRSWSHNI